MTLAIFNRYVDRATEENKTGRLSGRHGARHAGVRELAVLSLIHSLRTGKKGKHAKVAGRHARPARSFF
jgi:hypothetical protein